MQEVNGNSDPVSVGMLDETPGREASAFFDTTAPEFSAPKENPIEKKKPWKRKLIVWSLILVVIAAGVFALYVLVRVKRVEVRVNAESQRPSQTAKTEAGPNNSESGLSAEAINIARQAMGADQRTAANASSANTSTSKPASTSPDAQPTLNFSDNSPAYAHLTDTKPSDLNSNRIRQHCKPASARAIVITNTKSCQSDSNSICRRSFFENVTNSTSRKDQFKCNREGAGINEGLECHTSCSITCVRHDAARANSRGHLFCSS